MYTALVIPVSQWGARGVLSITKGWAEHNMARTACLLASRCFRSFPSRGAVVDSIHPHRRCLVLYAHTCLFGECLASGISSRRPVIVSPSSRSSLATASWLAVRPPGISIACERRPGAARRGALGLGRSWFLCQPARCCPNRSLVPDVADRGEWIAGARQDV